MPGRTPPSSFSRWLRWPRAASRFSTAMVLAAPALFGLAAGCELLVQLDPSSLNGAGGSNSSSTTASSGAGAATSSSRSASSTSSGGFDGGSTSASSASSSSGGIDAGECTSPAECPQPSSACEVATCTSGACAIAKIPADQPAPGLQVPGSCIEVLCDGDGGTLTVPDASNVGVSTDPCILEGCDGGAATQTDQPDASCSGNGGKVCSSTGDCVECNTNSDCTTGFCQLNKCVTSQCDDGVQDGQETDVDCGGPTCAPCAPTQKCLLPRDCTSDDCSPMDICLAPSCSDGIQNEGETGVDCGGPYCAPEGKLCAPGVGCKANSDCQSFICLSTFVCSTPSCTDGVQNGLETDVDCGGGVCPKCPDGDTCLDGGSDCVNKICEAYDAGPDAGELCCIAPTCHDGVQNGQETGDDCGGPVCDQLDGGRCGTDGGCADAGDCQSLDCKNDLCLAPTCSDGIQNEGETGVDCGGPCKPCSNGTGCNVANDCQSGYCVVGSNGGTCEPAPNGHGCDSTSQCNAGSTCLGPAGAQICCDTACTGNCQACFQAQTGQPDGTCSNITLGGAAPSGQCAPNGACGNDGSCDGAGNCQQYSTATPCGSTSCAGNVFTPVGNCNGTGSCVQTPDTCSGDLKCNAAGCLTSCSHDSDCATTAYYCSAGNCVEKGDGGATCTSGDQCGTGICGSNGVCCNAECPNGAGTACATTGCDGSGNCLYPGASTQCASSTCRVVNFTPTFTPAGSCNGDGACSIPASQTCGGDLLCNLQGTACLTSCGSDNDCVHGEYCSDPGLSGTCKAQGAPGSGCTQDDECASPGLCGPDGTGTQCCSGVCGGSGVCAATDCSADGGACSYPGDTVQCAAATCAGGVLKSASNCDGAGNCPAPTTSSCDGYKCNAAGSACLTQCGGDGDCLAGYFCSGSACVPQEDAGAGCSTGDECASGICAVNCCDEPCAVDGGDPECASTSCDTTGACVFPDSTKACGTASCDGDIATPAGACNSAGGCVVTPVPCSPYGCDGGACVTSCASQADCATGSYCAAPNCMPQLITGSSCTTNDQCLSGVCNLPDAGAPDGGAPDGGAPDGGAADGGAADGGAADGGAADGGAADGGAADGGDSDAGGSDAGVTGTCN